MATHIIHTPAAMFRGWMVMQLKRPEMAQAGKQETQAGISSGGDSTTGRPASGDGPRDHGGSPDTQHLAVSPLPPETSEANGTAPCYWQAGRLPQAPLRARGARSRSLARL